MDVNYKVVVGYPSMELVIQILGRPSEYTLNRLAFCKLTCSMFISGWKNMKAVLDLLPEKGGNVRIPYRNITDLVKTGCMCIPLTKSMTPTVNVCIAL